MAQCGARFLPLKGRARRDPSISSKAHILSWKRAGIAIRRSPALCSLRRPIFSFERKRYTSFFRHIPQETPSVRPAISPSRPHDRVGTTRSSRNPPAPSGGSQRQPRITGPTGLIVEILTRLATPLSDTIYMPIENFPFGSLEPILPREDDCR